jgi:membrane-associated phospholipid phosphatase
VFRVSAAAAAAYAALAGLVAAGAVNGIDRWAVAHAMPGAHGGTHKPTLAEALVPFLHAHWSNAYDVATDVVTVPASVVVSLLVLVALRRPALLAAWVAGNAVEELCKLTITRPALYSHGVHVVGFDSSFPSGHTLRTMVVAAAVWVAWPRLRPLAVAWAVASVALLELDGWHVPSDLAGGLLLALLLLGLLRARAA